MNTAVPANATPVRPICVLIYGINEEAPVHAYTRGDHWNGWECPFFTMEQAEVFAAQWRAESEGHTATFDAATDSWTFSEPDGGPEGADVFDGFDVMGPHGPLHVYAIGAWGWTWNRAEGGAS
jgi:hypothetical protein